MRRHARWICGLVIAVTVAVGCSTVPVPGRRSFNLVPDSQANALGAQAYQQVRSQSRLITSGRDYDRVRRVGRRLAEVADESNFDWQFTLIDDAKTANAFCLPGG